MNDEQQNDQIIKQLEILNASFKHQESIRHLVTTGIIYGIGFFIGSAIIATIALGILGPIFGKILWVGENFERGAAILRPQ